VRGVAAVGGAVVLALAAGAAVASGAVPGLPSLVPADGQSGASPSPGTETRTAVVEQRTMETAEELDGTLGYEDGRDVAAGTAGTVTRLPEPGSVVWRNGVLYELDGNVRPRLLYGTRPMWRPMGPGMSDGADVLQLERNLEALGYAPTGMKVDRHWDSKTTRAVKRWQRAVGKTRDGRLDAGDIAFLPGPVRVSGHAAAVGSQVGPGGPVLEATTARRVVTVTLAAARQDLAQAGQPVTITLPDESTVGGSVREVGRVANPGENGGSPTVTVTIDLDPDATLPALDAAPFTVHVVTTRHEAVLAVPVNALLALLEGGYAVEVVEDDGARRYVAVDTGLFDDGRVEVRGDGLAAGDLVVTAR
jgi:peptidoglycan hydrolase-like protein with peptidoglycan-binding domain